MRSVTASVVLVWFAITYAGQEGSQSRAAPPGTEKPRTKSVLLSKGKRPADPGGVLYREHWGGFWGRVDSVAFSPDGRYLLSAGLGRDDGTVRLWDVETGEELRRYQGKGHSSQYKSVAFSPDGKHVLAGSLKSTGADPHAAWLWDIDTTHEIQRYVGHTTHLVGGVSVDFSPDGQSIVTTGVDGPALLWDAATGSVVRSLGEGWAMKSAVFSPDGKQIVTGASDGAVVVWDASSGQQKHMWPIDGRVMAVEHSRDGQRLLVRCLKAVYYTDAESGQVIHHFPSERGTHASALSPDGVHALIGFEYQENSHVGPAGEGWAELYDLSTGKLVRVFKEQQAYDGWVTAAAFSPDGRFAATGSLYGPIRLWDVATGKQIRAFYGHLGKGPNIAFSGDGHVVIGSVVAPLESYDENQRHWLERIRKQQELTVGGAV